MEAKKKSTARTLTAALRRAGFSEQVRQGRGYVWLTLGDSHLWYSSSIPVCYTRELSDDDIVKWRNILASQRSF